MQGVLGMRESIEKIKYQFSKDDTFAIKGIAIIMMYVHHMFLSPNRWGKSFVDFWPLTQDTAIEVAVYFKICVALFVFLSAYGLTVKYKQIAEKNVNNISKFIFSRWYKLEMNFLFIFVLAWIYGYVMNLSSFSKIYGGNSQDFLK